jgi:hypothetical protein
MEELLKVTVGEEKRPGYLYIPGEPSSDRFQNVFLNGTNREIFYGLLHMGHGFGDFEFMIEWVEHLRKHPDDRIKRKTYETLANFCWTQERIPDPRRIIFILSDGILETADFCYMDIREDIGGFYGGRASEREFKRRSAIVTIFLKIVHEQFEREKININSKKIRKAKKDYIFSTYFCFTPLCAVKAIEKIRIKNYSLSFQPDLDIKHEVPYLFDKIRIGELKEALISVMLIACYEKDFGLFEEAVRIAMNRKEAVIRFHAFNAITYHYFIYKRWHERHKIIRLIEMCMDLDAFPNPHRDELIRKTEEEDYVVSPLEYYERIKIYKLGKADINTIRCCTEKYVDDEVCDEVLSFEDCQDW